MAYAPSLYDATNPLGSIIAGTAAAEFRLIKGASIWTAYRRTNGATVSNTAVLTNLESVAIPTGIMTANKRLKIAHRGRFFNNSGGAANTTIILAYGTQTICTYNTGAVGSSAANMLTYDIEAEVLYFGATNAQLAVSTFRFWTAAPLGTPTTLLAGSPAYNSVALTVDSTLAQNVDIATTMSVASPNVSTFNDSTLIQWT